MIRATLEELYFGGVRPCDEEDADPEPLRSAERLMTQSRKDLREALTPHQEELLEKYLDAEADYHAIREVSAFKKGFGLGMQLTLEGTKIGKVEY